MPPCWMMSLAPSSFLDRHSAVPAARSRTSASGSCARAESVACVPCAHSFFHQKDEKLFFGALLGNFFVVEAEDRKDTVWLDPAKQSEMYSVSHWVLCVRVHACSCLF